jgi:hypothetical protein
MIGNSGAPLEHPVGFTSRNLLFSQMGPRWAGSGSEPWGPRPTPWPTAAPGGPGREGGALHRPYPGPAPAPAPTRRRAACNLQPAGTDTPPPSSFFFFVLRSSLERPPTSRGMPMSAWRSVAALRNPPGVFAPPEERPHQRAAGDASLEIDKPISRRKPAILYPFAWAMPKATELGRWAFVEDLRHTALEGEVVHVIGWGDPRACIRPSGSSLVARNEPGSCFGSGL